MKDCLRRHRNLVPTAGALPAFQFHQIISTLVASIRTHKPIRPAAGGQVFLASLFAGELRLKFAQGFRKRRARHPLHYSLWLAETTGSVLSPKYEVFCCDQNGPPARREEGAYLNRYVTDEQRGRRPIFIATLWAGASWLFFRVTLSTRMTRIWALRSRLEKQPTDLRQNTSYFGDRTLVGRPEGEGGLIYYWRRGHYRRAETNGECRTPAAPGARFWSVQTQREYSEN